MVIKDEVKKICSLLEKKEITLSDAEKMVKDYYSSTGNIQGYYQNIDIVYVRGKDLLQRKDFDFSIPYLKHVHSSLFKDIIPDAGAFREKNISRKEYILNGGTVIYEPADEIQDCLHYDFEEELNKSYAHIEKRKVVSNLAHFISNIWQIHPFSDGNTRTDEIFLEQYIKHLHFETKADFFTDNHEPFRNSLVLSTYGSDKHKLDYQPLYSLLDEFITTDNRPKVRIRH